MASDALGGSGSRHKLHSTMLEALLHGKLSREQENMEDVLTSAVFGLFRLFAPAEGAATFLRHCRDDHGGKPLGNLALQTADYEFWPTWQFADCYACEPDVVIDGMTEDGVRYLIVVEAKYNSGKSSYGAPTLDRPYDQLAREWDNLVHCARERDAIPLLIYLTADVLIPRGELEASRCDFVRHRGSEAPKMMIYWLPWRVIPQAFGAAADLVAQSLVALAARLGLYFFSGFSLPARIRPIPFTFAAKSQPAPVVVGRQWSCVPRAKPISWSFQV